MSQAGTLDARIVMMPVAGTDTLYQGCCGLPGCDTLLAALFEKYTYYKNFSPI